MTDVAISTINTGTPNSGTGDTIYTAFTKVNNNTGNLAVALNLVQSNYANTTLSKVANLSVTNQVLGSLYLNTGTIYVAGSPVTTSASTFTGGNVAGQANFQVATASTSSTTGGVVITGGLGVGGRINTAGIITTTNITDSAGSTSGALVVSGGLGVGLNTQIGQGLYVGGAATIGTTLGVGGITSITNNTVSAGISSGALVVTGGVGIGGALNVGGNVILSNVTVSGTLTANTSGVWTAAAISLNTPLSLLPLSIQTTSNIGVSMRYYDSAGAGDSFAFAGRLVTGIGFLSNAFAYYASATNPLSGGVVGTQLGTIVGGSLIAANTTASTSTTTGVLVVSGGAGIAGALYTGSINSGAITSSSTIIASTVNAATIGNTGASGIFGSLNAAKATAGDSFSWTNGGSTPKAGYLYSDANIAGIFNTAGAGAGRNGMQMASNYVSFDTNASEAMRIDSSGNVGISTTAPIAKLDVGGALTDTVPATYGGTIRVNSATQTTVQAVGGIEFPVAGDGYGYKMQQISSGGANLVFANRQGSATWTERMRIDSSGNVGIGTSSPSAKLEVAGTIIATTLTGILQTAAQTNITSVGTLTGLTVSGAIVPSANNSINIGSTSAWFNTLYGTSSHALYADLAENYQGDADYAPGTVVVFGGEQEITVTNQFGDSRVAGVISTNPAYLMNATSTGLPLALRGRVPCQVIGTVNKGDSLVTSINYGYATSVGQDRSYAQAVFAKSLETKTTTEPGIIEVVIL